MIYYLAYGSNLHPMRLADRVPSADLIGMVKIHDHQLVFHKRGRDGSAKCSYIQQEGAVMYGAVYAIGHEEKAILDRIEDLGGGYAERQMTVHCHGKVFDCFTYQAQPAFIDDSLKPFHWYKQLVLLGARHLGFSENHVLFIESHPSVSDPDERRKVKNGLLIKKISEHTFSKKLICNHHSCCNPNNSGNNKGNAQSADKHGIDGYLMNFHSSNSGYFETSVFQCKYLNINSLLASSQSFHE